MNPIYFFHHIHHCYGRHKVEHCGGEHAKIDKTVNYNIIHCRHHKHAIDKESAIGHDDFNNLIPFHFTEKCDKLHWHIESGTTTKKPRIETRFKHIIYHDLLMNHHVKHKNIRHCLIHVGKHLRTDLSGHVHIKEEKWFC